MLVQNNRSVDFPTHQNNLTTILPNELIFNILSHLDLAHFIISGRVCKKFRAVVIEMRNSPSEAKRRYFPMCLSRLQRLETLNSRQCVIWRKGPLKIEGISLKFIENSKEQLSKATHRVEMIVVTRCFEQEANQILLKQKYQAPSNIFKGITKEIVSIAIIEFLYIIGIIWLGMSMGSRQHLHTYYDNTTIADLMEFSRFP